MMQLVAERIERHFIGIRGVVGTSARLNIVIKEVGRANILDKFLKVYANLLFLNAESISGVLATTVTLFCQ
jgi:hypothetical protein